MVMNDLTELRKQIEVELSDFTLNGHSATQPESTTLQSNGRIHVVEDAKEQFSDTELLEMELAIAQDTIHKLKRQAKTKKHPFTDAPVPAMTAIAHADVPVSQIVRTWLAHGLLYSPSLVILAGPMNSGKSLLVHVLLVHVAQGTKVFGAIDTLQRDVYIMTFEDSVEDVKAHIDMIADPSLPLPVHYLNGLQPLLEGGHQQVEQHCQEHPHTILLIDLLEHVRNLPSNYHNDYTELGPLFESAKAHDVVIVLVTHMTKTLREKLTDARGTVNAVAPIRYSHYKTTTKNKRRKTEYTYTYLKAEGRGFPLDGVQHHIEQDGIGGWKVALTPLQKEQLRKGIVLQVVKDAYPQSITRAALLRDSRLVEYSVRSVDRDLGDLVADGTISHTDKSPYKFVP